MDQDGSFRSDGCGLAGEGLAGARALFEELLTAALVELDRAPSDMAAAYLVELLTTGLTAPRTAGPPGADEASLGEALLAARLHRGPIRVASLRALGDRALFVAGVFGDSLARKLVDLDYYGEIGSAAYADLSRTLSGAAAPGAGWPELFHELAERFLDFVELLAEVGDRTRAERDADLLRAYDRLLLTGSQRDRRRLIRAGIVPGPWVQGSRRWQ